MRCTTGVNFRTTLSINDLCFVSQFLKPIVFADKTNFFCLNKEIKRLFLKANWNLDKYLNSFEYIISGVQLDDE